MSKKVSIIGNGNWGTTIGRLIAINTMESSIFSNEVRMWGCHEEFEGRVLNEIINSDNINPKYLPGIHLPENLKAESDLYNLADSDILVFALPHQYIDVIAPLKGLVKSSCIGVSLTKGFIGTEDGYIDLVSRVIHKMLDISVSVVMGANIANQVARDMISEATLGCIDDEAADVIYKLFNSYTYRVTRIKDVYGVEISGALKNVVAMAYGFAEGLGYCSNTKVAIFRSGLAEMRKFFKFFYPMATIESLFQSSGIGDLLVSCMEGRNYSCAKIMAEKRLKLNEAEGTMCYTKLQGPGTAFVVFNYLKKQNRVDDFPLMSTVYRICYEGNAYDAILECISSESIEK
ncbi:glycerol 3 phosphate dehydrogenase [Ordospora colligata]|uniref:Glycerol-3-phosphate dehydrogenase [NAD(+)] n=1 Tax=Ordospora colligata OC4 TaxID=1354746 RepID=A0A0B2UHL4_9MICR|nr:glycerol 3 phosphate dehydrogenase [Ordospora colligata OC4]KHN70576.1 glycerol 3 phosphate dehydrogenase [Ordospora colligata OC4]TBU17326.1 glycerol 3 phosphate dehydrogenase [Ordospora colligata]TBU17576.1 glycerol 3 phosphate dehydrogenase [Ordospora colligata]TBU19756.1 glycerol 3 phosphate dehydrogenase [Ordospora colligata]